MENVKLEDIVCLEDLQICNIRLDQKTGYICADLKNHNNVILSSSLSSINVLVTDWLESIIGEFPQLYNTVFHIDGQACHCVGLPFRTSANEILILVYDIDAAEFFNVRLEHVINSPVCRSLELADLQRNWCFGDRYPDAIRITNCLFPDEGLMCDELE